MARVGAEVTTPRHPVTGQFVSSGAPSGWTADTRTGATDTASAPPPSFPNALPDGLWDASEAEQAAAKVAFSAANGTRLAGPDTVGSLSSPDSSPGFQVAYGKLAG